MAAVDFTGVIRFSQVTPIPVGYGTRQDAPSGAYHNDRLGNRWGMQFTVPPMRMEPEGRRLQAMFDDAEMKGGLFPVESPDFNIGAPGSPTVSANTAAGKLIPIIGATPHYAIRAGQWLNYFDAAGQRYLDRVMEEVILDASGAGTIRIKNLVRAPLVSGANIELAKPKIEGSITIDGSPWLVERTTMFSFTVAEDQ